MTSKNTYLNELNLLILDISNLPGENLLQNYDYFTNILTKYPLLSKLEELGETKFLSLWGNRLSQLIQSNDKEKYPDNEHITVGGKWAILTCSQSRNLMIEYILTYIRQLMNHLTSPSPLSSAQLVHLLTIIPKLFILTSGQSELEREVLPTYLPKLVTVWLDKLQEILCQHGSSEMLESMIDLIALFPKSFKPFYTKISDLLIQLSLIQYENCPSRFSRQISSLLYLLVLTQTKVEEVVEKYDDLMNRSIKTCHHILMTLFQLPTPLDYDPKKLFPLPNIARDTLDDERNFQLVMVKLFKRLCVFIEFGLHFNHSQNSSFTIKLPLSDIMEILIKLNSIPTHVATLSIVERSRLIQYVLPLTHFLFPILQKLLCFSSISSLPLTIFTFFKHNYLQANPGEALWLKGMIMVIKLTNGHSDLKLNESKFIEKLLQTPIHQTECYPLSLNLLDHIVKNYWFSLNPKNHLEILGHIHSLLVCLSIKSKCSVELFQLTLTTLVVIHHYQTYVDYLNSLSYYFYNSVIHHLKYLEVNEWWNQAGQEEWTLLIHPQFPTRISHITDEIDYQEIKKLTKIEAFAQTESVQVTVNHSSIDTYQKNELLKETIIESLPNPISSPPNPVKFSTTNGHIPEPAIATPETPNITNYAKVENGVNTVSNTKTLLSESESKLASVFTQDTLQDNDVSQQHGDKENFQETQDIIETTLPNSSISTEPIQKESEFNTFISNHIDKLIPKTSNNEDDDDQDSLHSDDIDKMLDDLF